MLPSFSTQSNASPYSRVSTKLAPAGEIKGFTAISITESNTAKPLLANASSGDPTINKNQEYAHEWDPTTC